MDRTIGLWSILTSECLKILQGHIAIITSVAFSPNGEYLASGCGDTTIGMWRVSTGLPIKILRGHIGAVYSVVFSPNEEYLASGSFD